MGDDLGGKGVNGTDGDGNRGRTGDGNGGGAGDRNGGRADAGNGDRTGDRTGDTNGVVERELVIGLVLSPECSVPVPALLRYRTADPYAVQVTFHNGTEHPVSWTFARELLVEGIFRPCGHGDVRVWPTRVGGRGVVLMALSSPDGDALLEAPAAQVSAWLERTLRAVPPGTEADRLGVDDGLAELLAPSPADDLWLRNAWPWDVPEHGSGDGSDDGHGDGE